MNRRLTLAWTAASLLVAGAAAPVLAHEPAGQKQKIIILTERHDGEGKAHADAGRDVSRMVIADCDGDRTEAAGENKEKGERAKIVICSRGNASSADRVARLERVISRINSEDQLSAETKAKITTALRDAIARLNTTR